MPSGSSLRALLPAFALALCLTGCASVRSYDRELHTTLDFALSGNVDGAIRTLESNNRLPDKDLLYHLELGMLQRLGNRYQESQKAWMAANTRIQVRDPLAQAASLVRGASSYLINDKLRSYVGHDYEKVMLLTYIALNHLALGEYENARVAIKQTHELEAVIEELRSKEIAEVEEDAKKHGAKVLTGGQRLGTEGYFYAPTIVSEISDGVRLVDEEQFGPVLPIVSYASLEDAVRRANSTLYGLSASVWTADPERAAGCLPGCPHDPRVDLAGG